MLSRRISAVLILLALLPACAFSKKSAFEISMWSHDEVFEPTDDESWLINGGLERFEAQMELFAEQFGRDGDGAILWPEEVSYVFNDNAFIVIALTDLDADTAQKYMDMVSEPERLRFTKAIHKKGELKEALEYLSSPEVRADAQANGVTFYMAPIAVSSYGYGTPPIWIYVPKACHEAAAEYFEKTKYSQLIDLRISEWLDDLTVPDSWTEMSVSDWDALYTY